MIDNRTSNLDLQLPHKDNVLEDDVARLRAALTTLDSVVSAKADSTTLSAKADLVGGKIPAIQLPSFVDDVVELANLASAPTVGETGKIYVTLDTNKTYRWSGSTYVQIAASPGTTDVVPEGSSNLYFTDARALAAVPLATASVPGRVRPGAGFSVAPDGTLTYSGGSGVTAMYTDKLLTVSTNGQTAFTVPSGGYTPGILDLYVNGAWWRPGTDFTATDGVNLTLASGVNTTDEVVARCWILISIANAVAKSGDTMTGPLGLPGNASGALHAVPKQQLDSAAGAKVSKAGDTMTGPLVLPGNASNPLEAAPKQQVESLIAAAVAQAVSSMGVLSGRNRVINGGMLINQYNNTTGPTGTFYLDRWRVNYNTSSTVNFSQATNAPPSGAQNSFRAQVAGIQASLSSGNYCALQHVVEGYNVADFVGNTFTLSFWVRSSKTGIHSVSFRNAGSGGTPDRSYVAEYTVNVADTWEKKTITVTGGFSTASGTWNLTNGAGLRLDWAMASGATFKAPSNGAWVTGNYIASANQVNVLDTVNNIFAIADVQLEAGAYATPFERRLLAQELPLCFRYYFSDDGGSLAVQGGQYTAYQYKAAMRAVPNVTIKTTLSGGSITVGAKNNYGFNITASSTTLVAFTAESEL